MAVRSKKLDFVDKVYPIGPGKKRGRETNLCRTGFPRVLVLRSYERINKNKVFN